ncbi:hypothetical protein NEOLEDRAFT_1178092 [Neolentinus lepideus HHB14362 ss-1]|uniref:Uncharacterized protein n=1 Tax=Neolentinus lepideus HHB14362 ss-1 TaxID=1314782 RepID=A0A165T127_9AGAM|nr:hypothetical protein NEOLEDRAFT_1178092 [Neolentinus lepideus HHB14362 ss-1]
MSYEVNFTYYTDRATFKDAVSTLRRSRTLILDCEGLVIGMHGGALSLLCLGTADDQAIFVFDVLTLRANAVNINTLLQLLRRDDIMKITWDGRMDFVEIQETYGVKMMGVLDLQLAEVISRNSVRHEGERNRINRLARRYFGFQVIRKNPHLYKDIHLVLGMAGCLEDNKLGDGVKKDTEVIAMHRANGTTDIYLISLLYHDFRRRGWVNEGSLRDLQLHSQRYVGMFQDSGGLDPENVFLKGPMIMLPELLITGEHQYEVDREVDAEDIEVQVVHCGGDEERAAAKQRLDIQRRRVKSEVEVKAEFHLLHPSLFCI